MSYTDKDRDLTDADSVGSQTSSSGQAAEESRRERASTEADGGAAPEQTGNAGTKQRSEQQDPAATYEPEKKKSERETL